MSAKIKSSGKSRHRHSRSPKGVNKRSFDKIYWPYIPVLLMVGVLSILGISTGALTRGIKHTNGEVLAYSTSMQPAQLLSFSNQAREKNHESDFSLNDKLTAAAQAKANDMAARDYWSHSTPDGNPPWTFISAANYSYQKAGENLAAGFNDENSTVKAWLASPEHRHNLLDPAYRDVGFGIANIADYKAAGGGTMTIVVAFYGEPLGSTDSPLVVSANSSGGYSSSNGLALASHKSSEAQIGLANFRIYSFVPAALVAIMFLSLGLWAGRHILLLRKVLIKGERFVFTHPLMDVGLLVIAALAFLLNQTAGVIR